ncbi:MAG TPA: NosD domain-containing protein [Pyrinomonadaceae bacterium]|nr:NosD domain-containing protein [Pyrinomonadaceae bacterium]
MQTESKNILKMIRRKFAEGIFLRVSAFFLFSIVFLFAFSQNTNAQVELIFNDSAPTLETGTALSQGARYRFRTVAPGTDALVTLTTISNATLVTLDDNTSSANRFQPVIRTNGANITGYVKFDFQLVAAGTATARTVPSVYLSAQDIDGNGVANTIREWVEFAGTNAVTVASPTLLTSAAAIAGGTRYIQTDSLNNQAGIGTDNRYEMYTTLNSSLSTFTIVGGNTVGATSCAVGDTSCDRLNSYAFDAASSNVTAPAPDVYVTKSAPSLVNQNTSFTYTITAHNNGPTTAHGATISDTLPSNFTITGFGCTATGGAVCPTLTSPTNVFIPTFPSGGEIVVTITGTASTTGTVTNSVTVSPPNGSTDPNTGNNTATVNTTVVPVANLSIVKSQRQGTSGTFQTTALSINQNSTIQYQLLVTNGGTATATNAAISDTVPSNVTGLTVVSATGASGATACSASFGASPNQNVLTGNFSAPSGGTCTIILQGTVSTVGSITNTAQITPADINTVGDPNCSGSPVVCTGNNVSSVSATIAPVYTVTGIVFEDIYYSGGVGRSLASASGTGRGGATVEIYNSSGAFVSSATTASSGTVGQFQLINIPAGTFTVRVVNSTVTSSRGGSGLIGVQTFRTNGGTADTARVGGEDPTKTDAAANVTSATLASLTTATTTAQSISSVTISSSNLTGVDFGFNFDTIVNVNNSGQGSLRQFITNANAMSGADTSIFMISDGAAHSGLQSGLTNQLTSGIAVITLSTNLPAVTDANLTLDGTSQTTNVGNTNSGNLGTGGTVGVDNLTLSTVARPEIQISDGAANLTLGIDLQAASATIRGISIYGFGTVTNSDANANIRVATAATYATIEQNIIGTTASSFTDPGAGTRSGGDNIRLVGASGATVRNNLIGYSASKGIGVESGSAGNLIQNNEIRGNAVGTPNLDGVDLESAGSVNNTVRGNLIADTEGVGIDSHQSNGGNTIVNNTVTNNGIGNGAETSGIRIYGSGNVIDRNIVYANYGAGIQITSAATANTITRNSIYANGTVLNKVGAAASNQIGIDLQNAVDSASTGTSPFVTVNDNGDADSGGNGLLNFPVLENARILNGNLILTGFARPGATVEFFIAAPDASGFGEGQTYLFTFTEGSGSDTDATSAAYTSPFNSLNVGADTTNRFQFSIALPSNVAVGTVITSTATLSSSTSEFSNNVTVANAPPNIGLVKAVSPTGTQLPGTDLTYTITFTNTGGQGAANFRLTDPDPSNVTMRLNTNTDFKLGSVTNSLGTTGLTAAVAYSNDNGATFSYTPVSAGGGAAAGYDRNVTHLRWSFTGTLSNSSPNNTGNISFVVKIR